MAGITNTVNKHKSAGLEADYEIGEERLAFVRIDGEETGGDCEDALCHLRSLNMPMRMRVSVANSGCAVV
jgi:hypothetical protein